MRFNNVEITKESFELAKQYFIDINKELIRQVISGELKVNNELAYIQWKQDSIKHYEDLKETNNFTFLQRAYFFQTGECIPLLK